MQVVFDHAQNLTSTIKTFWFHASNKPPFLAGQFVEVFLPHAQPDKRGQKRWFTLSSAPNEAMLSITTRILATEASSFKRALNRLKKGDQFFMSYPMGDFVLPKKATRPIVFVAGGIGITPFRSMAASLATLPHHSYDITLLYAAKDDSELLYLDIFKNQNVTVLPFLAAKGQQKLTAQNVLDKSRHLTDPMYYVAGPDPMVQVLTKGLKSLGIARQSVRSDYFVGYA
jgi:ferredoxin-NADP reductase